MSAFPQKTIVITSVPNQTARDLLTLSDDMDEIYGDGQGPKKRRRLTHLTPEEKMLRRKLKNRVAAQTARDRKKVLMTDLETKVAQLEAENRRLAKENNALKAQTGSLTLENVALKDRLSAAGGASSRTESESGSAVSTDPLPQGQAQTQSNWTAQSLMTLGLTLLLACSKQDHNNNKLPQEPKQSRGSQTTELPCQPQPQMDWWGPHQKNWTPSMS